MCAWAVCLLGKERRAAASCLPSPSPHCCMHAHTHSVPWLQAVEMGGGGGGGSKIKLKIKACPESPSAQHRPAGQGGGCSSSPSTATRSGAGCPSVQRPTGAPAWPCSTGPPQAPLLPSVDQRSMGPGGCQGQGEIKGAPRDGHWDGNRDAETETWRQTEMETETEGCGYKDVGRRDVETQRHKRTVWRQGDVGTQRLRETGTQRHGSVDPGSRGRDPVPVGLTGQRRGQRRGRQRWRDGRDARERRGGGSVGAGPGAPIPRLLVITCPEEAAGS